MIAADRLTRFSDRVADYAATRPDYPQSLLAHLGAAHRLGPGSRVVDVGAGTGIFSRQLLASGAQVVGVEPNDDMRAACHGVDCRAGSAEATGLPTQSADLVTATQAFHWFEPGPFADECRRLLAPGGSVALIWNSRPQGVSPMLDAYEAALLAESVDYTQVRDPGAILQRLGTFFGQLGLPLPALRVFAHHQDLDRAGLQRRVLSSSYTPPAGHPGRPRLLAAIDGVFDAHNVDGLVRLDYETELWAATVG
jgi:SAM-dependent methyltransferase